MSATSPTLGELAAIGELRLTQERAKEAERRAVRAEQERDHLRAILSRVRTSLAEATTLQSEVST